MQCVALKPVNGLLLLMKNWLLITGIVRGKFCGLPKGKKAIKRRCVFKRKCKADGTVEKRKARLVAKDYLQKAGIDYEKTFAPTLSYSSIRLLLALAVQKDFDVNQMNVVTAFLNPSLKEKIYMKLPEGVEGQKPVYCRLNKSIYGLKQASMAWYDMLDGTLRNFGMKRLQNKPCIYHWRKNEKTLIVGIYVDDLIILSNDRPTSKDLKAALQKQFEMKDFGEVHWCLGMRIVYDKEHKRLSIHQERHIDQVLERLGKTDCKVAKTPLDSNQVLSKDMAPKTEDERTEMQKVPYREAVGCLIYLSQGRCPDISHAVGVVSRFCDDPGCGTLAEQRRNDVYCEPRHH
uniref:Reverse transcriptase Ty1/copia-type domain-containing protein n=1 Tax=Trichuris muris TaxID=70415 RepID=A0A5S6Q3G3_TRIMR